MKTIEVSVPFPQEGVENEIYAEMKRRGYRQDIRKTCYGLCEEITYRRGKHWYAIGESNYDPEEGNLHFLICRIE